VRASRCLGAAQERTQLCNFAACARGRSPKKENAGEGNGGKLCWALRQLKFTPQFCKIFGERFLQTAYERVRRLFFAAIKRRNRIFHDEALKAL